MYIDTTNEASGRINLHTDQSNSLLAVIGNTLGNDGDWIATLPEELQLTTGLTIIYLIGLSPSSSTRMLENDDGTTVLASNVWLKTNGVWKKCYYNATTDLTTQYSIGDIVFLTYNQDLNERAGGWQVAVNGSSTNHRGNYIAGNNCPPYAFLLTSAPTNGVLSLISTVAGTVANLDNNKVITNREFDPHGLIFVKNGNEATTAGNALDANLLYETLFYDLRYGFNITTLVPHSPVYLVASPTQNNMAILASNPITQVLPQSETNFIYIYLGQAYNSTSIELRQLHPIYCWENGGINFWYGNEHITGTGIAGYLAQFDSAHHLTAGIAFGDSTTEYLRNDGLWMVPYAQMSEEEAIAGSSSIGKVISAEVLNAAIDNNLEQRLYDGSYT